MNDKDETFVWTSSSDYEKPKTSSKLKESFSQWTTNFWGLEILSFLAATILLVAIIILLAIFDNKILPQWYLGITLNTILSILSGLFQWSLMIPVIQCIGQLKWLWFAQSKRPLSEFAKFEASSTPLGALSLLRISHL